jgi:feruloyl esterase
LITSAVLDACDTLDGVEDRLIENPLICQFDVATLACKSSTDNTSTCLTHAQLAAAQNVYKGPNDSRSGIELYPGFSLGSESDWTLQEQLLSNAFSIPILQNLVYNNLNYDYRSFNFGSDVDVLDEKAGFYIDEISTNLTAFKNAGGKLLVTQGEFPHHTFLVECRITEHNMF